MTVNELARATGTSIDAVRHYTKLGLLSPKRDPANGYRHYTATDQVRVTFIKSAKSLGFKIVEIKQILADSDSGRSPCPEVRMLLDERILENQRRLKELGFLQQRMETARAAWQSMPDGCGVDGQICPLIEALGDMDFAEHATPCNSANL
ncbi:MAG: MerR family transcriptional regulator [Gammaproteobacteria bacterium]|nr:MAG: MerR family transcriptional regulator [Gammaproteobacteria bacterium]